MGSSTVDKTGTSVSSGNFRFFVFLLRRWSRWSRLATLDRRRYQFIETHPFLIPDRSRFLGLVFEVLVLYHRLGSHHKLTPPLPLSRKSASQKRRCAKIHPRI